MTGAGRQQALHVVLDLSEDGRARRHRDARAGITPDAETMAGIGLLALAVNSWCFYVLWRHRSDDVNMRSTWLCSRNDLIANAAVLVAAGLVAWLASPWPDVLVGLGIAALFLRTAVGVISESRAALAQALESES